MVEDKKDPSKQSANDTVMDVEMKSPDANSPKSPAIGGNQPDGGATTPIDEATKKSDRENYVLEELREHAKQIEKSVAAKEQRFIVRVLRSLNATRKNINATILRRVISIFYNTVPAQRDLLLGYIEEPMDTGENKAQKPKFSVSTLLPEQDVYFHLLVVLYLLDLHNYKNVCFL